MLNILTIGNKPYWNKIMCYTEAKKYPFQYYYKVNLGYECNGYIWISTKSWGEKIKVLISRSAK
ncbi:hypothetical protein CMU51_10915 [Elizabethkingia anophelis]|uniref:Uncharacterized protein n=1 Tax=Elizabethkingia anophelis TaxID=1117645 RepID=A0AAE4T5I3_9FLAO|nr:hypothetical protein [Elizabethkingia anophelis]